MMFLKLKLLIISTFKLTKYSDMPKIKLDELKYEQISFVFD